MLIRVRVKELVSATGVKRWRYKYVDCNVLDYKCKDRYCLRVGKWKTQSTNYNNTRTSKKYSCLFRDYHGCPDDKDRKEKK